MAATEREFRDFVRAYIQCALWTGTNDGLKPLDHNYSLEDLSDDARAAIESECWGFVAMCTNAIDTLPGTPDGDSNYSRAGHLFWLNRNGYGTGFWDHAEEFGPKISAHLSKVSKAASERYLYVADNGELEYTFG